MAATACEAATTGANSSGSIAPDLPTTSPGGETATVVHVSDGDTVTVRRDGREERVRLIGINAPEQGECLADEARSTLRELVNGREIVLERDVEDADQFGRLLRYVWADGSLANAELVRRGLAIATTFAPNTGRQDALEEAEELARTQRAGIWDPAACGPPIDAQLEVVEVQPDPPGRDEENLNGEYVVIRNNGPAQDMGGLVLRDGSTVNRYGFPDGFVLGAGSAVTVHVGCGEDTATDLYWCASGPVLNNGGDEILVVTPEGGILAAFDY